MAQRERFPVGPFFKASLKTHAVSGLCDLLHSGRIVQHGLIPWGSNYTFLVTMDVQQPHLMLAVYKPRRGEAPLWDFPNGTLYRRERAAFVLSEALGWGLVPPTIIRHGPNGVGSLQLYVHHREEDADYFALHEQHGPEMQAMAAFDLISNNTDRKAGHCLRDEEGHVWGIDHGLTFHVDPKLRTVIWDFGGERVPKRLLRDVRRVRDDLRNRCGLVGELEDLLFPEEVDALAYRMQALLKRPEFPCLRTRRGVPWPFY